MPRASLLFGFGLGCIGNWGRIGNCNCCCMGGAGRAEFWTFPL